MYRETLFRAYKSKINRTMYGKTLFRLRESEIRDTKYIFFVIIINH